MKLIYGSLFFVFMVISGCSSKESAEDKYRRDHPEYFLPAGDDMGVRALRKMHEQMNPQPMPNSNPGWR